MPSGATATAATSAPAYVHADDFTVIHEVPQLGSADAAEQRQRLPLSEQQRLLFSVHVAFTPSVRWCSPLTL
jgi:hypothetical protein